jgi:hypothetical protein
VCAHPQGGVLAFRKAHRETEVDVVIVDRADGAAILPFKNTWISVVCVGSRNGTRGG